MLYCIGLEMVVHILIAPIMLTITNLIGVKTHWHAVSVSNCAPGQKLCSQKHHSLPVAKRRHDPLLGGLHRPEEISSIAKLVIIVWMKLPVPKSFSL